MELRDFISGIELSNSNMRNSPDAEFRNWLTANRCPANIQQRIFDARAGVLHTKPLSAAKSVSAPVTKPVPINVVTLDRLALRALILSSTEEYEAAERGRRARQKTEATGNDAVARRKALLATVLN